LNLHSEERERKEEEDGGESGGYAVFAMVSDGHGVKETSHKRRHFGLPIGLAWNDVVEAL